jgi:N-acetylglucosamine-6-sulfatase
VRKFYKHSVLFALLGLAAGLGMTTSQTDSSLAQTAPKPNIVFILADDMRASDLDKVVNGQYVMPNTQDLLVKAGVKFTKPWVTRSLCCPSRATILRGQYTHNHQVWTNVNPSGGYWKFHDDALENSTIATWLKGAGYTTILIGKYLNRYGLAPDGSYAPNPDVPPGWDYWYAWEGNYYSDTTYDINENGQIVTYQRSQMHDTDLHAQTAEAFIKDPKRDKSIPFFMYLAPNAPHKPAYSAPRHANLFTDVPLPKPSSFNEADVSDKPAWVRNKPLLSSTKIQELTNLYRQRLRALKSVDDMVGTVVSALGSELDNTYIVLTSDNGVYLGEHRLEEKAAAYNAAPRIPLVIRGPGVPQGVSRSQMVLNNDFAPTIASWAGVQPPPFVDGRSLAPLLATSPPPTWRSAFLVEHRRAPEEYAYVRAIPKYYAIRTPQYSYVEYPTTGERELYDLNADPTELTNIYSPDSPVVADLHARLNALKSCAGWDASAGSCKTAEGGS